MTRSTFKFHTFFSLCVLALGLGPFLSTSAQAILVTTTVSGSVDFADASNPFGLTTADSVTAVATYDDSGIPTAAPFTLAIDSDPGFALTITLGSFVFQETDDDLFGSGAPRLEFNNGALVGISFEIDGFPFGIFPDLIVGSFDNDTRWFLDEFVAGGADNTLLEGTWDFANAVTLPNDVSVSLPEPATWLILASGLLGLVGMTRRASRRCPPT
ncbi:MAG: hypothetical protein Tsb0017_28510 [Geothermobacteraceae bacterium]